MSEVKETDFGYMGTTGNGKTKVPELKVETLNEGREKIPTLIFEPKKESKLKAVGRKRK